MWRHVATRILLAVACLGSVAVVPAPAADSRFATTHNRSQYVHWIDLYDADERKIDPTDPEARPFSTQYTCGRCHDYQAISHGFHFYAPPADRAGRPGEPWIWTDSRTGTQLPLSYRGWAGTYDPRDVGVTRWDFVLQFGHHLPGGGPGEGRQAVPEIDDLPAESEAGQPAASPRDDANPAESDGSAADAVAEPDRWSLSGTWNVDCLMCHRADSRYSPEVAWKQIQQQNFAWATTAALGIADVEGAVAQLPDDFEPPDPDAAAEEHQDDKADPPSRPGPRLPVTRYRNLTVNAEGKVFFDLQRKPSNDACYYCHTTRAAADSAGPEWTHDQDIHLRAGMSCVDCHRHGIDHLMVRGYEGEPATAVGDVVTLSCRGCHLGVLDHGHWIGGGRLGAPRPEHRGLPLVHLERLSCTACHSGPRPAANALPIQTAKAHQLGLPSHHFPADLQPLISAPVFLKTNGVLFPHRVMWPAFWGKLKDDEVTPLHPETVQDALRRKLRVRRNETFASSMRKVTVSKQERDELLGAERAALSDDQLTESERDKLGQLVEQKATAQFREKLVTVLPELKSVINEESAEPVYVAGGRLYRIDQENKIQAVEHPAARPYAWKLAHDVRPGRWSSGAGGCTDCHAAGAPLFDGIVAARGPAPDDAPPQQKMAEWAGYDVQQLNAWNQSFRGRSAFKIFGFASAAVVGLVVLVFLLLSVNGLVRLFH